jgi:hypothetical protein
MITTEQLKKKYGTPTESGIPYLTTIQLPYPMRLAWDKGTVVTKMRCHNLVAGKFIKVFSQILNHYGLEKIKELGIDLYGGCFNYRKMRGGSDWSRHSWGVAIDLDPERNQLKETKKTARFARPEYKPMIDIFYANGFVSLGVEKDYDWMHWEISS